MLDLIDEMVDTYIETGVIIGFDGQKAVVNHALSGLKQFTYPDDFENKKVIPHDELTRQAIEKDIHLRRTNAPALEIAKNERKYNKEKVLRNIDVYREKLAKAETELEESKRLVKRKEDELKTLKQEYEKCGKIHFRKKSNLAHSIEMTKMYYDWNVEVYEEKRQERDALAQKVAEACEN